MYIVKSIYKKMNFVIKNSIRVKLYSNTYKNKCQIKRLKSTLNYIGNLGLNKSDFKCLRSHIYEVHHQNSLE